MSFFEFALIVVSFAAVAVAITLFLNVKPVPNIKSDNDVLNLLREGNTLKAIKAYRQLHGVGLKEAKRFITNRVETDKRGPNNGE